ncbi:hypothetical protein FFZ77_22445 [Streptomyces katsurahamanus]|uniref:Uncharacterized protein n=1 Tax=Streptomyces katsurahamanus TaxID=2577098 RepID=A0ABW9NYP4_9ACTN|nr:hypothetical protein [Streptomyces katsurahamanus]
MGSPAGTGRGPHGCAGQSSVGSFSSGSFSSSSVPSSSVPSSSVPSSSVPSSSVPSGSCRPQALARTAALLSLPRPLTPRIRPTGPDSFIKGWRGLMDPGHMGDGDTSPWQTDADRRARCGYRPGRPLPLLPLTVTPHPHPSQLMSFSGRCPVSRKPVTFPFPQALPSPR